MFSRAVSIDGHADQVSGSTFDISLYIEINPGGTRRQLRSADHVDLLLSNRQRLQGRIMRRTLLLRSLAPLPGSERVGQLGDREDPSAVVFFDFLLGHPPQ